METQNIGILVKPRRKNIPERIKTLVLERQENFCACGCGSTVGRGLPFDMDHRPALSARRIKSDGSDYIPAQLDPTYLFALTPDCHAKRTFHPRSKATSLGSDLHMAAKVKRLRGETGKRAKKKIANRPMRNTKYKRKMDGTTILR